MTYRLLAVALVGLAASCRQQPHASQPSAVASTRERSEVVAEIDGTKVTSAELEDRSRARLARLRQEEYEIRKEALDNLVGERLIEAEAKRRGLTREALVKAEVD